LGKKWNEKKCNCLGLTILWEKRSLQYLLRKMETNYTIAMTTLTTLKKTLATETIKNQFVKSGISHVSIFGSYARGEAKK
jgi:hypothetical protein